MPGILGYNVVGSLTDYWTGDGTGNSDLAFPQVGGVAGYLIVSGDVLSSVSFYGKYSYGPTGDTTVPIAIYDLANVRTTGADKLLATIDVPWTAAQKATNNIWITASGLNIDLSAHVGKRIGIVRGIPADDCRLNIPYDNVENALNKYSGAQSPGVLPATWPGGSGDEWPQQCSFYATITGSSSDTTPNAFTFTDQSNVATSTVVTSAAVTISGIDAASAVTVTGGEWEKNASGTWTTSAGTVINGDTVRVRHISSASAGTATNTTLTIGGVSDTFTSTTVSGRSTSVTFMNGNDTPAASVSLDWYLTAAWGGAVVANGTTSTNGSGALLLTELSPAAGSYKLFYKSSSDENLNGMRPVTLV